MDFKTIVKQNGNIKCPLCNHSFDWSYEKKMILLPEKERVLERISDNPRNHITYLVNEEGKVKFNIVCDNCLSFIETKFMNAINPLIREENF